MTQPWQPYIHQSFESARLTDPSGTNESAFYGPYTRLLYTLFSLDSDFEVIPQYKEMLLDSRDSVDFVTVFVVELNRHPVFFIEITPPAALRFESKREDADKQMRLRFRDLRSNLAILILYGVSAFGTRLCFYRYERASIKLQPPMIRSHGELLTDVAPLDRWDCDVLEVEGATRFRDVIEHVKQMCAQL
ncbi:hypothetical protein M422DRAFT_205623 [Sphaerobolus stellatus SS14]|nr:hypothetical protein M422DRAFT_205623 [Sphaerobolus stellatus SS14]